MQGQNHILTISGTIIFMVLSCNGKTNNTQKRTSKLELEDTVYHGYNELANPDQRKLFTISDFNTDNPDIKNIDRPNMSRINSDIDTTSLFAIWTSNPDGPHADFVFSEKSFYIVDYDGDGNMPYILSGNDLKVYYNDFIQEGEIISVSTETLIIKWKDIDSDTKYFKWNN